MGRRIIYLWAHDGLSEQQQTEAGFANLATIPREVLLTSSGGLYFQPIAELSAWQGEPINFYNVEVTNGTYDISLPPGMGQQYRFKVSQTEWG